MSKGKNVLTTGQVAKICNVAPRTVSKWFDSGRLKGYRIPGSKDRRIPLSELDLFMKEHDIPGRTETDRISVLIINSNTAQASELAGHLSSLADYEIHTAEDEFTAGILIEKLRPAVVIVDTTDPAVETENICRDIRKNDTLRAINIIAVTGRRPRHAPDATPSPYFQKPLYFPDNLPEIIAEIEQTSTLPAC